MIYKPTYGKEQLLIILDNILLHEIETELFSPAQKHAEFLLLQKKIFNTMQEQKTRMEGGIFDSLINIDTINQNTIRLNFEQERLTFMKVIMNQQAKFAEVSNQIYSKYTNNLKIIDEIVLKEHNGLRLSN